MRCNKNDDPAPSPSVTFLLSSNRQGGTYSVTIKTAHLRAAGAFLTISFCVACTFLADYLGLKVKPETNRALRAENTALKQKLEQVSSQLTSLELNLSQLDRLTRKIEVITNLKERQAIFRKLAKVPTLAPPVEPPVAETGYQGGPLIRELPQLDGEGLTPIEQPPLRPMVPMGTPRLAERIIAAVENTQSMEQKVLNLIETLTEHKQLMDATPSIRPTHGWYTSRFGYRLDPFTGQPAMHAGIDFASPPGSPVWATGDGIVRFVGVQSGYGNVVIVDHGYGVETVYAHNSQILVNMGDRVKRRQKLATIGSTGRSTGPHVHYEVRVHGQPVDPVNYLLDL